MHAQVVDASQWQSGSVDLVNGWREHDGDDLGWAQPAFDDSQWQTVELDSLGASESKFRWYRLHVKLPHGHMHEHLLIVGGEGVYAAYVNGQPVEDARLQPWYEQKRPVEEIIPLEDDEDDFTIALRTHPAQMYALWHLPLFLTVSVGSADAMDNERVSFESQRYYAAIPSIAINLVLMLAGLGAFALFRSQLGHDEYIWLSAYLLLLGISNGLLYCSSSGVFALAVNNLLADPMVYVVTVVQIEFTFRFAGRSVSKIWRAYEVSLLAPLAANALVALGRVSTSAYVTFQAAMILPAALLLPVLLLIWYRKGNREAGWLIVPSLFPAAMSALYDVGNASLFTGWGKLDFLANPIPVGPVVLQLSDLADFLYVLAIAVVMFFRFTRVSREQTRAAAELGAAREIQQRLVPAKPPRIAGYTIEAAYFPAQEVGGDFYQIFAQGLGTQMLVVGDVSGKGLKAAMTGTLALGALRALATQGLGPAEVLMRLNRQLAQTAEDGFVTCVCARVTEMGEVTIANAGHLAPYKNGVEIVVEAGLPLGIAVDVEYTESTLRLGSSDVLTFMTDGVVEARNGAGELFGFERTSGISGKSAEEIADTAQQFGQEDDITVLTLARS
ncbi:MAG TPA: PP2C family protein-serine/threonine phosphatase [Terracidiphilus sp.]|jgi:sigma-B regulation protein RsbU (phosphoserine phosphatase)|nr:PP2C family protein-serine/threonine phosphatase [Terracidiphilus sp.]